MKKSSLLWLVVFCTLLFCFAIGFDVSPYLRGPSYYPPEWRWEYLFENTLNRIYLPVGIMLVTYFFYTWAEKKKVLPGKSVVFLLASLILLFVLLQFGILYFSRSGIGVLIHRIINPEINGYFTAALTIQSVPEFLRHYNSLMLDFVYHAKAHPPGAILLFYYIQQVVQLFPLLGDSAALQVPNRPDVRLVWDTLLASQKATVFASAVIIPLLSALSIIPLYFTAKLLYGFKSAIRSLFLFLLIPSLIFFIPINDAFLHFFSLTAFCFFVYGLHKNNIWFLLAAGSTVFLGAFFNLSLLPILVLFFVYFLLNEKDKLRKQFLMVFKRGAAFLAGLLLPFALLFIFFQFNFITMTMTIMQHVPDVHTRSYTLWIFYNLYDFFVFTGIPVALIYFSALMSLFRRFTPRNSAQKLDLLLIAFTVMILVVNFSGSVRGETGRIWIPYIPFIVLIAAGFLTKTLKLSTKQFAVILGLQALQLLVMQEFWVMLW